MRRIDCYRLACTTTFLMAALAALAAPAAAAPNPNSAVLGLRIFNDCPFSTITAANSYPGSIFISDDADPGCPGFANLHNWSLSEDGTNQAIWMNGDVLGLSATLVIDGPGQGEAGLRVSPWWSPDVDKVYYSPVDGSGARTEFLGGAGGYSGVEYLTVGGLSYILVVNDASNPRRLCIHLTDATEVGCSTLPNSRYEDLAFDGRYLYAADFYGHRIDKIDILVDGGSIFNPPGAVPEPGTWTLLVAGFLGLGTVLRRRRLRIVA